MYLEEVLSDRWKKRGKDHRHEETMHAENRGKNV
jgi:hypothetical protein